MEVAPIRIKVRTSVKTQFEVQIRLSDTVQELKVLLSERTGTPIELQRLIYQGKVLSNSDTLASYKIQENHVLQLIPTPPSSREDGIRLENSSFATRPELISTFLLMRRRRRLFAHREIDANERFEVLRQAIQTLEGLIQSATSAPSQPLQPFDRFRREFYRGQWVDVKDTVDQWLEAQITDVQTMALETYVYIHYNGWPSRWDEWIEASSTRIQPIRTNTLQTLNAPMHSAHLLFPADADNLQPQTQYDFSEFVFQTCSLLDHVKNMLDRYYVLKRIAVQERELDRRELTQESLQLFQLKPGEERKTDELRSDVSNVAISSVQEPISDEEKEEASCAMTTDQEVLLISAQMAPILDRAGRLLSDIGVVLSGAGVTRRLDDTQSVSSSLITNESGTSQVPVLQMQIPAMATPSELSSAVSTRYDISIAMYNRRSASSSPSERSSEAI